MKIKFTWIKTIDNPQARTFIENKITEIINLKKFPEHIYEQNIITIQLESNRKAEYSVDGIIFDQNNKQLHRFSFDCSNGINSLT